MEEKQNKTNTVLPAFSFKKNGLSTGKKVPQKDKLHKSVSVAMLKKHNQIRSMTARSNLFGVQNASNQMVSEENGTGVYAIKIPGKQWSGQNTTEPTKKFSQY